MRGPFGGVLEIADGVSREIVAIEILRLFPIVPPVDEAPAIEHHDRIVEARGAGSAETERPSVTAARAVQFCARERGLEYDADLSSFSALSLAGTKGADVLRAALSAFCERIACFHDEGRVHGDLRPELVGWCGAEPSILVSTEPVDAPALLRARLAAGAPPAAVAFVAPEVAEGAPASAESDVYSLAAVVYFALARRAPLGLLDVSRVFAIFGEEAAQTLIAALSPDVAARPDARALARLLQEEGEPERESESMMGAVLLTGGAAVFTGILALAVSRFSALGDLAKLAIALGTTLGILVLGALLARRGSESSGVGLLTVAAQLLWADAYLGLALLGYTESHLAWAAAGLCIGVAQALLAARFTSRVMGAFAALALAISALTLGLLLPSGSIAAALYAAGVGSVYLVIARVLAGQEDRTLAIPLQLAAVVATFASVALSLPALRLHALWSVVWPYVIAGLAVACGARTLGVALALLGPTVQALALYDEPAGPHFAAFATLGIAWLFGERLREPVRRAACVIAGVWAVASSALSVAAIARTPEALTLARHLAGPYLLAIGHLALKRRDHLHVAAGIFALAPVLQTAVFHRSLVAVLVVQSVGLTALACVARARSRDGALALLVVGLGASALAPAVVVLATRGDWSRVLLLPLAAAGMLLLALGRARPSQPEHRRALEVASVLVVGGVPLLSSLPEVESELAFAGLTLVSGVSLLGIALWRKRLFLALASSVLLLSLFTIQYFAKLSQAVHWGILCVGFGLVLLASGVLYEKKLKGVLPAREWE
jgi:hypothetical protein